MHNDMYLLVSTAESLQQCYANHPVVVVSVNCIVVDSCYQIHELVLGQEDLLKITRTSQHLGFWPCQSQWW